MNKIRIPQGDSALWLNQEFGIRDNAEFDQYRPSTLLDKIKGISNAILGDLEYHTTNVIKRIVSPIFSPKKYDSLNTETTNKKGLVVFFHGLNATPDIWTNHINTFEQLSEDFPEFSVDLFAPPIPEFGHCTFEDKALLDYFDNICEWAINNPKLPIVTIAHSNGSRIAAKLEILLRERAPQTPVHISLIAGVLFGTSFIKNLKDNFSLDLLNKLSLGNLTPVACENLDLDTRSAKDLLQQVRMPLKENVGERYYRKYAAMHDAFVPEIGSSLPIMNQKERDYLVPDHGHGSVIKGVLKEQVIKSFHWINQRNGITDSKQIYQLKDDLYVHANKELGLMEIKDHRSLIQKITDVAKAIFREIAAIFINGFEMILVKKEDRQFPSPICSPEEIITYPSETLPWSSDDNSSGLTLCIHGVHATPFTWDTYVEKIKSNDPNQHIFVPHVPFAGNCDLKTAAEPLLEVVRDFLRKFPGKPINIIGTSNGGRIAEYIENNLEPELLGTSKLSIVSIAGVHYGTKMVDLADNLGMLPLANLDVRLAEEFHHASDLAKQQLAEWHAKQDVWKINKQNVRHLFCASTEDEQVWDQSCSLPYHKSAVSDYHIVSGYSHVGIIEGVRNDVFKWLEN